MVATRSRSTALWYVALMVFSTLVISAPTSVAAHPVLTTTTVISIKDSSGTFVSYPNSQPPAWSANPLGVVSIGDTIRYDATISWPSATCVSNDVTGTTQGHWKVAAATDIKLDGRAFGDSATAAGSSVTGVGGTGVGADTITFRYERTATATTSSSFDNASAALPVSLTFTCEDDDNAGATACANALAGCEVPFTDATQHLPNVWVDTVAPVIAATTPTLAHTTRPAGITFSDLGEIGSTYSFTPSVTDAAGAVLKMDQSNLISGATATTIPSGAAQAITIQASNVNNWNTFDSSTAQHDGTVVLTATDTNGNPGAPVTVTLAKIDNQPPDASVASADKFFAMPSFLDRRVDSVNALLAIKTQGATGVAGARAMLASAATGTGILGNVSVTSGSTSTLTTSILGLANPLTDAINVKWLPIDSAGNVNTSAPVQPSPDFPAGISVEFGGTPAAPTGVSGTGVKNVYVNVSANGPNMPYTDATTKPIYGEMMRQSSAGRTFWKVATTGHTATGSTPDFSSEDTNPTSTTSTIFEPATGSATSQNLTASGARSYTLVAPARSGVNFADGQYEVWVNVSSPNGNNTRVAYPTKIDSLAPCCASTSGTRSFHQNYTIGTAHRLGFGPNMTDLHGADNNLIRVLYNITDWRTDDSGRLDSGLRNITFELTDLAQANVIQRTGGQLAQLNITPGHCHDNLSYCVDLPATQPAGTCSAATSASDAFVTPGGTVNSTANSTACAWNDIVTYQRWNTTFSNSTTFAGWVNLTWPDLPAGKFKVRVVAFDNVGLNNTTVFDSPTDTSDATVYRVGPAVKIIPADDSPRVNADGTLNVTALAEQNVRPQDQGATLALRCGTGAAPSVNICPVQQLKIFVSNTNGASDNGVELSQTKTEGAAGPAIPVPSSGWTSFNSVNGTPEYHDGLNLYLFPYTWSNIALPSGIDGSKDVYVRARADTLDSAGNIVFSATTGWVKASSALAPSLLVRTPAACPATTVGTLSCATPDWPIYLRSDFTPSPYGPAFNISFDRKLTGGAPKLTYTIYTVNATPALDNQSVVTVGPTDPDPNAGPSGTTVAPSVLFNWTGYLRKAATTPLDATDYRVHVEISDSGVVVASGDRFFSIMPSKPTMDILTDQLSVGVVKRASTYYVGNSFEVPFRVTQGTANLTDASQIHFVLSRVNVGAGQKRDLTPGDGSGFAVALRSEPLDASFSQSNMTAVVTMPSGISDGDQFTLVINASVIPYPHPATLPDPAAALAISVDKLPPTGDLLLNETTYTVLDQSTRSSVPRDLASPSPAFIGFTQDTGAGVSKAEVRVFDQTLNKTVLLTTSAPGYRLFDGVADSWLDSSTASSFLVVGPSDTHGVRIWTIPLTTAGAQSAWKSDGSGIINTSHTYRIDTRVTDNMSLVSGISSSKVSFDGAAPTLGFVGRLGTTSSVPSGILAASPHQVSWHGSAILTVNVTDNECLEGVRLMGFAQSAPNVTLMANMSPVGFSGRACYQNFPLTSSGAKFAQYSIDLINAPNMTDIIGNYVYWFQAEDESGKISEIPAGASNRAFVMQVLDNAPATVSNAVADPNPAQIGGRTTIRANVFDNLAVDHVDVRLTDLNSGQLLANGSMTPVNGTPANGTGWWSADTQDDLHYTLESRDYLVNVTPYDVNWNRTVANGGPTCPNGFCVGTSFILRARDLGFATISLDSPLDGATVNATPVFKARALSKALNTSDISVVAGVDGQQATIAAANLTFVELTTANGTRQGWSVMYAPGTLPDGANYTFNVSAHVAGGATNLSMYHFRVDALPPTVHGNVTGTQDLGGKTWATSQTRVEITANDTVSTSPTIQYTVNGGSVATYTAPITPSGNDGDWRLEYWAVDAVGNAAAHQNVTLALDHTGPRISIATPADDLLLTVTDAGVGVNSSTVVVHYRYGDTTSYATQAASQVAGNSYAAHLPGNASETGLAFYVTADDVFGNSGANSTAAAPYVIPKAGGSSGGNGTGGGDNGGGDTNNPVPPTIHINKPAAGDVAHPPSVTINWTATDPSGLPITISIATRTPAPGSVIAAAADNNGTWTWSISGLASGAYTLVLTASNGQATASDNVTFNIDATPPIVVVNPPVPHPVQGQTVTLGVQISPTGKTVKTASYRLLNNGLLASNGKLTLSSGVYAASLTPTAAGNYRVLADITYSDGTQDLSFPIGAFSVAGAPAAVGHVFHGSLIALAAIAVLTAALAAYGAFGRWKK